MILERDFYTRDPMDVARDLVGACLCCDTRTGELVRARICELELYHECERGCHAYGGKCTARNDAMFMAGGHAYVYLCYGLHNMINIVVGTSGVAAAVLLRALEIPGANGPGKLTARLGITRCDNRLDLTCGTRIWCESGTPPQNIVSGPRIGIDYAGNDALLPWRFGIEDSSYLSRPF